MHVVADFVYHERGGETGNLVRRAGSCLLWEKKVGRAGQQPPNFFPSVGRRREKTGR